MTSDDGTQPARPVVGTTGQGYKRVAADVLIRDEDGRVLLVDPTYKPHWDLPGGMAEADEPPRAAAARELREELGLMLTVGRLLAVEWVPPHGPWDDHLMFVFDGGTLPAERGAGLRPIDPELSRLEFVSLKDAAVRLRPDVWQRLQRAHTLLNTDLVDYHESNG
ncbi:MAG: NUDIX domain-containing protein [Pseudonocardiaceae bacterium]